MSELAPQEPLLDQVSSFELRRPVVGMEGFLPAFGMAAYNLAKNAAERDSLRGVQFVGDVDPKVSLVTAEEIATFHERRGLLLRRATRGLFKNYIDRDFADVIPETTEVPALPFRFDFVRSKWGAKVVVELAAGRHSLGDRRVMQGMLHRFNGLDESDESIDKSWPTDEQDRGYPIFVIPQNTNTARTATGLVHRVLEQKPEIIPEHLICGALQIVRRGVERPRRA